MQFNWSTIGHESVKHYFERILVEGIFRSHAFVLSGPDHIGKTTFVRDVLALMLCEAEDDKPCGLCNHCVHLQKKTHPDVYWIARPEESNTISTEDIRQVIDQLQSSSLFRSKKICVIEGADILSNGAANALLKTLEEPTKETFFFFITSQEEAVPLTIRSRCQTIRMHALSRKMVYDYLLEKNISPSEARELSQFSEGKIGLIDSFAADQSAWKKRKEELQMQWDLLLASGYAKKQWYAKKDLLSFSLSTQFAHDLLLHQFGLEEYFQFPWIHNTPELRGASPAVEFLSATVGAVRLEQGNVNYKMIIDSIHASVRNMV